MTATGITFLRMSESQSDCTSPTVKQIDSLPWVTYVGNTANHEIDSRRDATHRVETDISELRWDREIHELQQFAEIVSISTVTGRTPRLYITL